jgi:hypothetical protein
MSWLDPPVSDEAVLWGACMAAGLLAAIVAGLLLSGCAGGLPAADAANLENAARTSGYAYLHEDGGPQSILIKATHCSVQAVIRNQKLPPYDAGIACN